MLVPFVTVALGAMLALPLAGPAAATEPPVKPSTAPAVSTTASGVFNLFYQRPDSGLEWKWLTGGVWSTDDLGGVLSTGPGAVTIGSESGSTWVFAAGANGAVYYRRFSAGTGEWGPWTSIGGRITAAPAVTCVDGLPVVIVRGADRVLWRRNLLGGGWESLGGRVITAPALVPAVGGVCAEFADVIMVGDDHQIWEYGTSGEQRVGGLTEYAPTLVQHPTTGEGYMFVIGTDGALWMNHRNQWAPYWDGFSKVGGSWTSAPAAQIHPASPATLTVTGLGLNGRLYRAVEIIGGAVPWTFSPVP